MSNLFVWILTGDRDFVLVSSLYGEERHKTKWPDNQERPKQARSYKRHKTGHYKAKTGQERPKQAKRGQNRPTYKRQKGREDHKRGNKLGELGLEQRGFILDECQGRVGRLRQRRWGGGGVILDADAKREKVQRKFSESLAKVQRKFSESSAKVQRKLSKSFAKVQRKFSESSAKVQRKASTRRRLESRTDTTLLRPETPENVSE